MEVRVIPCLLLSEGRLVKTVKFSNPRYIGDPINTVRIFNELEVDELCFLDITASRSGKEPEYDLLRHISDECFMPLSYGGGINSVEKAKKIFQCGFEKIVLNTAAIARPELITELADRFGSQSIIVSIDVQQNILGQYRVKNDVLKNKINIDPLSWAEEMQSAGAGEILLTSISHEGTWKGFNLALIKKIAEKLTIPVIAHGGCGSFDDIKELVENTSVGAVALGSMVVYQKKGMGVLINFPKEKIQKTLRYRIS